MTAPMLRRPNPHYIACPVAPRAHPLAREFFRLLGQAGVSMTDVAERAGLGLATVVKWKYRHVPKIDTFEAALNVLGYELRVVPRRERR